MKRVIWLLAVSVIVFISGCGQSPDVTVFREQSTAEENDSEDATGDGSVTVLQNDKESFMEVYICGAVKSPGVYELPEGSIVDDALKLAGGTLPEAERDYINLAARLSDGDMIYFPYASESDAEADVHTGRTDSKTAAGNGNRETDDKVDINTASKEELMTLPGIGESKASAIVDYREKGGPFSDIEDIKKVNGIGEKLFDRIKDLIRV